jgi:protein-tyrosine phosphatase
MSETPETPETAPTPDTPDTTIDRSRDLDVTGFSNLRDVGGLPGPDGTHVVAHRLLRSDFPFTTNPSDLAPLHGVPVSVVVDLRDKFEKDNTPPIFEEAGFTVAEAPIFAGSAESFVKKGATLTDLYDYIVTQCGTTVAKAVQDVVDTTSGAALVHCTAGKDRTGVIVALILSAIGVPRDAVVHDYTLTEPHLRGAWLKRILATLGAFHQIDLTDRTELLVGSPASAIEAVLDKVESGWGGAAKYLEANGLAAGAIDTLKSRLLEA